MAESSVNVDRFRKLLLAEKERLEREMEKFHAGLSTEETNERKRSELGSKDASLSLSEVEREMGYHDQLEGMLAEVHFALRRLEEGQYGLCEVCHEPIREERLEALPFAKLCIKCQEQTEG